MSFKKSSAFFVHLVSSILAILTTLIVIWLLWYPKDLIIAGALDGLKILIGVDIILGPLLTLIIFNTTKSKRELTRDMLSIVTVQIAFFFGGLWIIYQESPLAQVLSYDGMHLIARSDIKHFDTKPPKSNLKSPTPYLLDLPKERSDIAVIEISTIFSEERPLAHRDDLYRPFTPQNKNSVEERLSLILDEQADFINNLKLTEAHKAYSQSNSCFWVPLKSKHATGAACVHSSLGVLSLSEASLDNVLNKLLGRE